MLSLFLSPLSLLAQSGVGEGMGGQLFPVREWEHYSNPSNPAFCARSERGGIILRTRDRGLLPELALQSIHAHLPQGKGSFQLILEHYGDQHYREGSARAGYALPVGPESSVGLRWGPGWVWIGEGHGRQQFWEASVGVRSSWSKDLRWQIWIEDPHSVFHKNTRKEWLNPGIFAGGGKKWPGGHTWSLHISKELGRPLWFRTKSRIGILRRVEFITGLEGLPLSPFLGWSFSWGRFFFKLISSWHPSLGFTPSCSILYTPGE